MGYEDAAPLWFGLKNCGWTIEEAAWQARLVFDLK